MGLINVPANVAIKGGGKVWDLLGSFFYGFVEIIFRFLARGVAGVVSAFAFMFVDVGKSLMQALEYYFPTINADGSMSAYTQAFGYAQAWFDIKFFLQIATAYWTFVAVYAMAKWLLAFIPGIK